MLKSLAISEVSYKDNVNTSVFPKTVLFVWGSLTTKA